MRRARTSPDNGKESASAGGNEQRCAGERGSASLEFIGAGLILLVPLVYLVLALSQLQAGVFGVEGAARQAARVFVQGTSETDARESAQRAIEFAFADYGINMATATVAVTCDPVPTACLQRRGFVTVVVRAEVALPLAPTTLSGFPSSIPLEASATQQVSRFWSGD